MTSYYDRMKNGKRGFIYKDESEYFTERDTMEDWNSWLAEQEENKNAVQEQETEEVSVQEEAESSEETIDEEKE